VQIGLCVNGVNAGWKRSVWKIFPVRGLPNIFPPEVRAQATALACSLPKDHGRALSRWSLAEIIAQLTDLEAVVSLAPSTLWRWLTSEKIKPWRYQNWQHILNPQAFLERARPVLEVYMHAQQLLRDGVWAVCVDEKTSIQARQAEQRPQAAQAGQPQHVSPRYSRHGALQLFAGLSVADGQKYVQTAERKRFVDFQTFLSEVIFPEALRRGVHTLILILDNGPTHAPKQLQNWLEEQVQTHSWSFTLQVLWLPTNASWLDQIEIWFSVLTRKLLRPTDFESLAALEQAIMEFVKCDNQSAKPIQWTYTVEKLERKLGAYL
jgi:hypothetical protein